RPAHARDEGPMKLATIQTRCVLLMALGVLILLGLTSRELVGGEKPAGPLPPAEELKTFRLADPNLVVELVAAEPAVISPVAVAWDEGGGMYVAEMSDYPLGPPGGRVKRLTDPDDQGTYQKASVIAERLPFPSGVLPYKGGVLVTAAPNIWHFPEAGGKGRSVLSGFAEGNQQLRVNGLYWGRDSGAYGPTGRRHGTLRNPEEAAGKGIPLDRRDFRFHPDNGEAEALSGFSQFGLAQDDWGNRFLSWNTQPFRQAVLEE